jgi:hypothetical protein
MNSHIEDMSSPSPLPRGGGANTDDVATPQARSSQPPAATPAPASTLKPFAPPFESAGAGSYRSVEPLPAWLHLSPSSSSDEDSAPPPKRGKGKAPMADPPSAGGRAIAALVGFHGRGYGCLPSPEACSQKQSR